LCSGKYHPTRLFDTAHACDSLRGGGKKRKKKTYTTPKKIKHKRKKVKMSILKYYKVDSDGKIKRLRRECPTATCGAGVFVSCIGLPGSSLKAYYDIDGLPQ